MIGFQVNEQLVRAMDYRMWTVTNVDYAFPGWELRWTAVVHTVTNNERWFVFKHSGSDSWALTHYFDANFSAARSASDMLYAFRQLAGVVNYLDSGRNFATFLRSNAPKDVVDRLSLDVKKELGMVEACPESLVHRDKTNKACLRLPYVYAHVHRLPVEDIDAVKLGQLVVRKVLPRSSRKVEFWKPEQGCWIKANHYVPEQFDDLVAAMRVIDIRQVQHV
jgi:hypothetical protein